SANAVTRKAGAAAKFAGSPLELPGKFSAAPGPLLRGMSANLYAVLAHSKNHYEFERARPVLGLCEKRTMNVLVALLERLPGPLAFGPITALGKSSPISSPYDFFRADQASGRRFVPSENFS